jgi:HEPN domain-containing protein
MSDLGQPWAESGKRSLAAAEVLFREELWPQACFNAQQCVELMFKAAIASRDIAPPRVHGIMELLSHLEPKTQDQLQGLTLGLQDLDRYYSSTRYPDAVIGGLPGRKEAVEAVGLAQEVVRVIETALHTQNGEAAHGDC